MNPPLKKNAKYETRDTNFPALLILLGLLFVILSGVVLLTRVFDRVFARYSPVQDKASSPLAQWRRLPPEPRLQVSAAVDLIRMRDVEDETLNHYAWIDSETGKVRIPITRAMEILVERGLPARKAEK